MALLPFYWLLISIICLGSGAFFYALFFPDKALEGLSLPQVTFLGAAFIGLEALALSLFLPVNPSLLPAFALQSGFGFWMTRNSVDWRSHLKFFKRRDMLAIKAILILALAMKAAAPVGAFDAGLYYRQTVLWVQEYGSVPGLANLHGRLAFNSIWHLLVALFSFDLGQNQILEDLNEWLTLLFGIEIASRIIKSEKGPAYPILAGVLSFILPAFLAGTSADLPAIILTIWLLMELYRVIYREGIDDQALFWIGAIGLFLFLIKLSMLPIAVLIAAAWWLLKSFRVKLGLAGVIAIALSLWIGRYFIQTGYLLYPLPQTIAFPIHPDWQVPLEKVEYEATEVEAFAKVPYSIIPHEKLANEDRVKMDLKEWLPIWLKAQTALNKLLVAVFLASAAWLFWKLLSKGPGPILLRLAFGVYIILAFELWFLKAPDPRFAYGLLLGVPFFVLALTTESVQGHRFYLPALIPILITCLDSRSLKQYNFLPGPYPRVATKAFTLSGTDVRVPVPEPGSDWETRCWNTPIPCTYDQPGLGQLEMRGPTLRDGFRFSR